MWERLDRFKFKMEVNTIPLTPPREGDRWLMTAFEEAGFDARECETLNLVRLHQQAIFESDVFGTDGRTLDKKYLSKRQQGEMWSDYLFSRQNIRPGQFQLWKAALEQLAPRGRRRHQLGAFIHNGHKIWNWRFDQDDQVILRGPTIDGGWVLYEKSDELSNVSRRDRYVAGDTVYPTHTMNICDVKEFPDGSIEIASTALSPSSPDTPNNFLTVLEEWGCTWLWRDMKMTNSTGVGLNISSEDEGGWLADAIEEGSLVGVTDGSYIRELCPHLCSAAVILECTKGRGRLVVSFTEQCINANAYRGELLGLMALHLILLAVNKTRPALSGSVHIYSDCLGALNKVEHLPPHRIPSKCRHSDILKVIMLNCQELSFTRVFSHVSAHQDDIKDWTELLFEEQLNSGCDHAAKKHLRTTFVEGMEDQQALPLEAAALFINGHKCTTESGKVIRYEAQRQEARAVFLDRKVLDPEEFDLVDWPHVYATLHEVPKMFQIFACKQVFGVAAVNRFLHKRGASPCNSAKCQSCTTEDETTGHILSCAEEGRVAMLNKLADELLDWLDDLGTPRDLTYLIVAFIKGRGQIPMDSLAHELPDTYHAFARAQDRIGWRRFLEGMVASELFALVQVEQFQQGSTITADKWIKQLIQKLLELTHGMWIYRNLTIHDTAQGVLAVQRKEELLAAIEAQIAQGGDGLAEEDKWMLEVNLGDLDESCTGVYEAYWLMAITTARERYRILETSGVNGAGASDTQQRES